jgi:hypothetical protein
MHFARCGVRGISPYCNQLLHPLPRTPQRATRAVYRKRDDLCPCPARSGTYIERVT